MLTEWWSYLTTKCSPEARRLGYLREAIAIRARYRRCHDAWATHLAKTQAALLASAESCRQRRTALILGSGLLLDIPLAELAKSFKEIWLVDMVHLPVVKRTAQRYGNVRCIEWDVTESIQYVLAGRDSRDWGERSPTAFLQDTSVDWVASVNLLSQLPLLPLAYRGYEMLPEHPLALAIMQRHLDYLSRFRAPVCLVADAEHLTLDNAGNEVVKTDLEPHLGLDKHAFDQWWWELAPLGELGGDITVRHRVVACRWPSRVEGTEGE